jgi:hypothetical protein
MSKNVGAPMKYFPTCIGTVLVRELVPCEVVRKVRRNQRGSVDSNARAQYMDFGARGGAFVDSNDDFYDPVPESSIRTFEPVIRPTTIIRSENYFFITLLALCYRMSRLKKCCISLHKIRTRGQLRPR